MPQVGFLSMITKFICAVALRNRVTGTIKTSIISTDRFKASPAVLMLAMDCAEVESATWLIVATRAGFPVLTTQMVVGTLISLGIVSSAKVSWAWDNSSVCQIAASGAIGPLIAAAFAVVTFETLKFGILER